MATLMLGMLPPARVTLACAAVGCACEVMRFKGFRKAELLGAEQL
jgi:hypothetical protein